MSTDTHHVPGTALLIAIGGVVLAIIVGVALARSDVEEYPAGSAEATAQTFVQSFLDGDLVTAHAQLAPRLQARCAPSDLHSPWESGSFRVTFEDVHAAGDDVAIDVAIRSLDFPSEPLHLPGIEESMSHIVLERFEGGWRIIHASWPLDVCGRR